MSTGGWRREMAPAYQPLTSWAILGPGRPMTPRAPFGRAADAKQLACMIEPPSQSPRIVAHPCPGSRSIPGSARSRELDERRLFPDLDGVAAEMRRHYS